MNRFGAYLSVTKPGIIVGNLISTAAGFFLAAKSEAVSLPLFSFALLGIALVIASGCVINNLFDRDIDSKMSRTRNRVLVNGGISVDHAFVFALILLLSGTLISAVYINLLATVVVLLGYIFYVFFYTMWYKRTSVYGTLIGSLSGAVPPLFGYLAVTNYMSLEAVVLFVLFCLWQMPHSYAIALFRLRDYQQAQLPVLPVVAGIEKARRQMIAYVLVFNVVALALYWVGNMHYIFLLVAGVVCFIWTHITFKPVTQDNYVNWAKNVFKMSLVVVMGFSSVLGLEAALVWF